MEDYPWPALVLLDLQMPGKDGFEVLEWIRGQPRLSELRVVVFSGSHFEKDVDRAYALGADSYVVKPHGFPGFVEAIRTITSWTRTGEDWNLAASPFSRQRQETRIKRVPPHAVHFTPGGGS